MTAYNDSIMDRLALSLTAKEKAILPHLPYLLQDLWELGSVPEDIITLLKSIDFASRNNGILDLACGKGAVSVKLSKALNIKTKGIDIIKEFIDYAKMKAKEYNVEELCSFEIEDINLSVQKERNYDCVILGATGNVLGTPEQLLTKLKPIIVKGGYIVLDDAYVDNKNNSLRFEYDYLTYQQWLNLFDAQNLTLINKIESDIESQYDLNISNTKMIEKRANQLKKIYKDKSCLFDDYVKSQMEETEDLNDSIIGVTWLLQKN